MRKTKIEWCDATWNPLTGCRHGCTYCYAASIAKRFCGNIRENKSHTESYEKFGKDSYILEQPFHDETGAHRPFPFGFAPTFHRYRLGEPAKLNGRSIFVGSMCDLFGDWVPFRWREEIFNACKAAPQHTYLFLTKNPGKYDSDWWALPEDDNFWDGASVTKNADWDKIGNFGDMHRAFLSFEPLLEEITFPEWNWGFFDWFIIGAESGKRIGKVVPEKAWVDGILDKAAKYNIPVFMKDSLIPIVGEENMVRDFPPGMQVEKSTIRTRGTCMRCGKPSIKKYMVSISGKMGRDGKGHTIGQMCLACLREWLEEMGLSTPEEWRTSNGEKEKLPQD